MNSDFAWRIFEITGNIEAYMIYIEQCKASTQNKESEELGDAGIYQCTCAQSTRC
ncbi:MAG: YqzL family protein [Oscillospiraceae bacterium]|nr:YqzL family protein [Oscillospiraceae bacterium]